MVNERLAVTLGGIPLDNPIIPASGTFGFGCDYLAFYDPNILGTIALKGTTLHPRYGNPTPRIAESPQGMLNAVGLQNPGVHAVIDEALPKLSRVFHKPAIANIGGFSIDEYAETARLLDAAPEIGILEINISCPNVHDGGMSFGTDPEQAAAVCRAVKAVTAKPVYMKLSPNVTDIVAIAKACESAGADGISMINTLLGMRVNLNTRRPVIANRTGGLSGPAILPIALRMVWDVYEAVSIPIIGMGGISAAEDVIEMMLCGASAVQIGAANLVSPQCCAVIIDSLPGVMDRYGINRLRDIVGAAHERRL